MDDDFDPDAFDHDAFVADMREWAQRWDVDNETLVSICRVMSEEFAFLAFVLGSTDPEDNVRWQQRLYAGAGAAELRAIVTRHVLT